MGRSLTSPGRSEEVSVAETQWSREGEMWTNELRTERAERVGPRPPGKEFGFYSLCDRKPLEGSE